MLDDLFKSSEEKTRLKVEEHFKQGMQHLQDKFYNQAMIEFKKAMELNQAEVYPRLLKELDNAISGGEIEAALAVGLNLLKEKKDDFMLANKLGNYAREMKDYKQAEGLYKMSLKINKNFEPAFYNLAASMARVDIYDEAAKGAVSKFDKSGNYILPDYKGDSNIIEKMTNQLAEKKKQEVDNRMQQLISKKNEAEASSNTIAASEIKHEIDLLKGIKVEIKVDDILEEFDAIIQKDPENQKEMIYNMAIYALKNNRPEDARRAINVLSTQDNEYLDLLTAICLDIEGKVDEATDKLIRLLGKNEFNRYNNVNLGLMYKRAGKKFLSVKYLIRTAYLLEKSGGLYSMKELVKVANQVYAEGKLKKALGFYLIAVTEIFDPELWIKIGTIYIEIKNFDEAVNAFKEVLKLDPESNIGDDKLNEIHNYYIDKGEQLVHARKFKAAVDYYQKALKVLKKPETFKAAAGIFKELGDKDSENAMLDEWRKILEDEKNKELERERQELIKTAKEFMQKKNYLKAIQVYEQVFRMKLDKNIFLQLAALYKGLKRNDDLNSLVQRWSKMVEHDEKMQRYEKEMARQQSTD
ncbi:MAG: tetratricopeptide repeat protein [Deltaproteobacteria bacterium]|nr:tetratricopeptide repeat protein [Deltaproteobacteria bacterium]